MDSIDWSKGNGLVPAIVQDADSGVVLMLGYMNRDSLDRTVATGRVTFFSRSHQALWMKGETSGNYLSVLAITLDCDGDTMLVQARPAGPVCHAGTATCFPAAQPLPSVNLAFLAKLEAIIADRIERPSDASYTAKLHAAGMRRIAQKVGEEGLELALAAAGGSDTEVIAEAADLVFHMLLLLNERGLSLSAAVAQLERRQAERCGR